MGAGASIALGRNTKADDRPGPRATVPVGVGLVACALAFACVTKGAFYSGDRDLLYALVALPALVVFRPWRRPRLLTPHIAAAALAASAALSGAVNGRTRHGLSTAALLFVLAVVVEAVRRLPRDARRQLTEVLVWLGVALGLFGWWAVATRWWPYALPDQHLWRSATTLTYANAAAALLVPLFLLSLAAPAPLLARYALLVSLGATQSRGGVAALLVGGLALLAVDRAGVRRTLHRALPAALGAAVALAVLLPLTPTARAARPGLAAAGLLVGAAAALASTRLSFRSLTALAAAGLAIAALTSLRVPAVASARANAASQDRIDESVAAIRTFQQHPVLGAGAGVTFAYIAGDGRGPLVAQFAHNEYLQLLAEQGAVGGVAFLLGVVAVGRLIRRGRAEGIAPPGCIAALAAFAAHSALDFLWHIPALALLAAILVGLALPGKESTP